MRNKGLKWLLAALLVAWTVVMFCLAFENGARSSQTSGFFVNLLRRIVGNRIPYATLSFYVRKGAHFTGFAIEGALLMLCGRAFHRRVWETVLVAAALCGLNEAAQLLAPGRSCELRDMCIDFSGSALGMAFMLLVCVIFIKKRHREK